MKRLLSAALVLAGFCVPGVGANAATLDDVMARLESLQRDNQAMRAEGPNDPNYTDECPKNIIGAANAAVSLIRHGC